MLRIMRRYVASKILDAMTLLISVGWGITVARQQWSMWVLALGLPVIIVIAVIIVRLEGNSADFAREDTDGK